MKFSVLTLFPEMISNALSESILGRAISNGKITFEAVNIRDYTEDKHGKVDDYTYGGGAGMLMQAQPVYDAYKAVAGDKKIRTIYVTPQGHRFDQKMAADFSKEEQIVIICGHYEGIDDRVLREVVTDYVSIGDYVLTGGEMPAIVMIDAISRLIPGVLNNDESAVDESFNRDLLEYPQYSRPPVWHGKKVPEILMSGKHREIEEYRLRESIERTKKYRPDLYEKYEARIQAVNILKKKKRNNIHLIENLNRGIGDLICNEDDNFVIYNKGAKTCLVRLCSKEFLNRLSHILPEDCQYILINEVHGTKFEDCLKGYYKEGEYIPYCYTENTPLQDKIKNVKISQNKNILWAMTDEKEAGSIELCPDGSIGLPVLDSMIMEKLIVSAINLHRSKAFTPYLFVPASANLIINLLDRLGLYGGSERIIKLKKELA